MALPMRALGSQILRGVQDDRGKGFLHGMMDVALITCSEYPQLSKDHVLLLPALAARGIDAAPLVWNDPAVDWSLPVVSVICSTWDYHFQRETFLNWAWHVSQLHTLWNPFPLLRWNTHKSYLLDLERKGISVIPTLWLSQGASFKLDRLMKERNWSAVVVKPAVSAGAYETLLVREATMVQGQQHLERMLSRQDMLIQPFFSSVIHPGERSLIFIDGEITHAVKRQPALDLDSATQDQPVVPEEKEIRFAHEIFNKINSSVLYGRVDLVRDEHEHLYLMEVELVEPGLWLFFAPAAVERFADAIARKVREANLKGKSRL